MSADAIAVTRRRFTVDEYERMVEAGILGPDDRVELLDGEIVEMSPIGPPHGAVVDRLTRLFVQRLGERAIVRVQGAVRLPPRSMPEPDVALLNARDDFYSSRHPGPPDVLLVVEVSDTTLAFDRFVKGPLYARARIEDFWVVDVAAGAVIVHRSARAAGYADVATVARGQLAPVAFPDVTIDIDELLV